MSMAIAPVATGAGLAVPRRAASVIGALHRVLIGAVLASAPMTGAQAAPLDALLGVADQGSGQRAWQLEAGRDLANDRVDLFDLRGSAAAGQTGNYEGNQLGLRWSSVRWQLDARAWRRKLHERADTHVVNSWRLGAQTRLAGPVSLRVSAWGNQASTLSRSTGTRIDVEGLNAALSNFAVQRPRDRQLQFDLIGKWSVPGGSLLGKPSAAAGTWQPRPQVSTFAGMGASRVSQSGIAANALVGNCPYQLEFGATELVARPADSCSNALTIRVPNGLLPFNALNETRYNARLWHAGAAIALPLDAWTASLGYDYQRLQRDAVDDIVRTRGGHVYDSNHVLIAELAWRHESGVGLLLRGQYMRNQFVGDIPFVYNPLTASKFGHQYGFFTVAMNAEF
jgi:opacity protein-like surface antigen